VLLALLSPALVASAEEAAPATVAPPTAAPATAPLAADAPMPLTSPAKSTLAAIQDNWLQWDSAFQRGEESAAGIAVDDLLQAAGELGMNRLPEVCSAVLARATISAADGGTPRARWALDMAERLDPGRPDVEFARAAVDRHEGRYLSMLWSELNGYRRVVSVPLYRRLTVENLLVWALAAVILSGVLFVALQLCLHGPSLIDDIAEVVSRKRPVTTAYLVALVVFILPVLVPAAWVVLPVYWAILLFPYARRSERAVIAAVGVVLLATPFLLSAQARRVAVELSAPMEATRSLAERRLYGSLIKDVDAMRAELPDSAAAIHMLADLHQDLGQIEYARLLYQRLVDTEPLNVAAHNNIGVYYLRRRETSQAIEHLEKAAAIDETRLEPHRNLWSLYRDYLAFEEAEQVLARVRAVAPNGVANWFTEEGPSSIVVMRDGYRRASEIRSQLRAAWKPGAIEPAATFSLGRTIAVAGFLVLAAVIAVLTLRSRGSRLRARPRSAPARLAVAWVPGLLWLHQERGWRAFFAVLAPVSVLLLPRLTTLGYRLPWGFNPGAATIWILGALLLLFYLLLRWRWARSEGSGVV
jgi:tetratricopeptide (TPR) repeat protein